MIKSHGVEDRLVGASWPMSLTYLPISRPGKDSQSISWMGIDVKHPVLTSGLHVHTFTVLPSQIDTHTRAHTCLHTHIGGHAQPPRVGTHNGMCIHIIHHMHTPIYIHSKFVHTYREAASAGALIPVTSVITFVRVARQYLTGCSVHGVSY